MDGLASEVGRLRQAVEDLPDKIAARYVSEKLYLSEQAQQDREINGLKRARDAVVGLILATVGAALLKLVLG